MAKKKFKFFVPCEISKSENDGEVKMVFRGEASSNEEDTDKEILEPGGFILDKFIKSGFFNWNHKASTDPSAIIGEPTQVKITNNKLYLEGFLYPDSEKAIKVYKLGEVLEKNSPNRRLGFSIEGRALERDPHNPKRILKALITGCAITPTPKNPSTWMELVKGDIFNDDWEYDVITKSEDANGGDIEYIVDVIDDDGIRRTVDSNFNIKIQRAITTESIAPLTPESVECNRKKIKKANFFEKKSGTFSKSQIFSEIFSIFTNDTEKAKEIYTLLKSIQENSNSMAANISEETIKKAQEIINLASAEVKKGEEESKKTDDGGEPGENSKIEKAMGSEEMMRMKGDYEKMQKAMKEMTEKMTAMEASMGNKQGGEVTKKSDDNELKQNSNDDLVKSIVSSIDPKFSALGTLIEAQREKNKELSDQLVKSEENFKKSEEVINELAKRLNIVESAPAHNGKSVTTKPVERFEKGEEGMKVLSVTKDRDELTNTLYNLSKFDKGEDADQDLVKAFQNLEMSGQIAGTVPEINKIANKLSTQHKIKLTL